MKQSLFIIFITIIIFSCTANRNNASHRSLHSRYSELLKDAELQSTSFGNKWFVAAERSLAQPLSINLPYKEIGYFASEQPSASGYKFSLKRGERLVITLTSNPANRSVLFADLWKIVGTEKEFEQSMDSSLSKIEIDMDDDASFVLRLQPKLLESLEYTLSITTSPSMAFPVRPADNPKVSSLWGAARDGGARSHEGIDIFARRGTPVIAVSDGTVSRVNENNLGGKVIFMRPQNRNLSVYYAHLDSQIASPGQRVKAGDIIGLIGNTGNARTTAPHLHFGIYTSGGAVDPYPFVNTNRPPLPDIKGTKELVGKIARLNKTVTITTVSGGAQQYTVPADLSVEVIAAYGNFYKIRLPGNIENFVAVSSITTSPLRNTKTATDVRLLEEPHTSASPKSLVPQNTDIMIRGRSGDFFRIEYKGIHGWIPVAAAR